MLRHPRHAAGDDLRRPRAPVAEICDTEMAAISLVDEDRQWFKAAKGIEDE
jgi:hypothetical protein